MEFFGIVQYIGADRSADWSEFYPQIFGFTPVPDSVRFGIMPKGHLLRSPCGKFFLQLIEPDETARFAPAEEHLQRIGFGTPDVMGAVAELSRRGVEFVATEKVRRERARRAHQGRAGQRDVRARPRRSGGAMNYADIGIDTASLAGSLESKLAAARAAGFAQVMISAADIVGHPGGTAAGARAVRECGLRVTGLEALRDFEGLAGQLHAYKLDVAKAMLDVCYQIGSRLLLVEASTSAHADAGTDAIVRDLRKLAVLAVPLGIRIAFKGLARSRTVKDFAAAGDLVFRANCPNLGIAIDAFDVIAAGVAPDDVEGVDPEQIFLVQLSDYMWQEIRTA